MDPRVAFTSPVLLYAGDHLASMADISRTAFSGSATIICPAMSSVTGCLCVPPGVFYLLMKFLHHFAAALLLLLFFVVPAMACMAPDAAMTAEERACCRMMKNNCGQMEMPVSHDCCKKKPATLQDISLRSDLVTFHLLASTAVCASFLDLLPSAEPPDGWVQRPEHSQPKSPPSIISSLRL